MIVIILKMTKFTLESSDSINGRPTGTSTVSTCDLVRFSGNNIQFQVDNLDDSVYIRADITSQPPTNMSPIEVDSVTMINGMVRIRGRVRPNARISISLNNQVLRTIIADGSGNFQFDGPNISRGSAYKLESGGSSSYLAITEEEYTISIDYERSRYNSPTDYYIGGESNLPGDDNYVTYIVIDGVRRNVQTYRDSVFVIADPNFGRLEPGQYVVIQEIRSGPTVVQSAETTFNTDDL